MGGQKRQQKQQQQGALAGEVAPRQGIGRSDAQQPRQDQVRTGSHGATDLSPVCMGAALHFDLSVPNFGIQEYMRHTPETDAVFPHAYSFSDGYLYPGDVPGHGVDIDETLAASYPYDPAQLPIARLEDGTMWNW